jgi:protein ImuB
LPTDRIKRSLSRSGKPVDSSTINLPWIVVAKEKNAVVIVAVDDTAARIGLEPGIPLANARAMCPDLNVIDEDKAADTQMLNAIADWCDRFTPLVALDPPHGLFLDVTGCAHLFGGERAMLNLLCRSLDQQGFRVNAAIASTPVCARTMTRAASVAIVPDGREAEAVCSLPLFALGAADDITRGLRRAGLKTIGDVAARQPHEIAARFGADFTALLRQALGQGDHPISPRKPLPDYVAEKRFPEPVASDLPIAVTLDRLGYMLIAAMERDGKGARRLEAAFFRTDGIVFAIPVEAGRPVTQARTIARLFREKLDALSDPLDPGFGFDLIRLSASHAETVVQEQRDLDAHAHDDDELAGLIDRIAARIGSRRVIVHLPQDTHIPERAALAVSAQHHLNGAIAAAWNPRPAGEPPLRPLRMLDMPEEIDVGLVTAPDGAPTRFTWRRAFHRIVRSEGPERIAMEWWKQEDLAPTRDYFRVEDDAGLRFWLYRDGLYGEPKSKDGKPLDPKWFMHGVFA